MIFTHETFLPQNQNKHRNKILARTQEPTEPRSKRQTTRLIRWAREGSGFKGIKDGSSMDPEKIEMEGISTPPDPGTIPHPEETSTKEENGSPPVIVPKDEEIDSEEHLICEPGMANI